MVELAKKIRTIFELAKSNIDLPGFWNFPVGSCQGASLFLGKVIEESFPESAIEYVEATDNYGEIHFWLTVDGHIFDITADQFPEVNEPIYGSTSSSLQAKFKNTVTTPISLAFSSSTVTTETYKDYLMINFRYELTGKIIR
ncbi:TPA: hypothetical protein ACX6QT_001529 [Photobacterium damselae]